MNRPTLAARDMMSGAAPADARRLLIGRFFMSSAQAVSTIALPLRTPATPGGERADVGHRREPCTCDPSGGRREVISRLDVCSIFQMMISNKEESNG
jgi:hypothetical protein